MMYEVTNYGCDGSEYFSLFTEDREEAERICENINRAARRGLCPFSEIINLG